MRVIITGSRFWWDFTEVQKVLDRLGPDDTLAHGACPAGADRIAHCLAKWRGIKIKRYYPDWKAHGTSAGPIRNQYMLDDFHPHLVVGFILEDYPCKGTRNCLSIAESYGTPTEIHSATL